VGCINQLKKIIPFHTWYFLSLKSFPFC